jgi:hypothetical protein
MFSCMKVSNPWKLEILITSTFNFYYSDKIKNKYKRAKKMKIIIIYHAFWIHKRWRSVQSCNQCGKAVV